MSKSSGEFLTLQLLENKGYDPLAYRYFLLGAHYRQQLAFTWEALDQAAAGYRNLKRAVLELRKHYEGGEKPFEVRLTAFRQAVEDDLNMPRALAAMWAIVRDTADAPAGEIYATLLEMDKVLGLGIAEMAEEQLAVDPAEVEKLIAERNAARAGKDYARADAIRDELTAQGIELLDGPEGTTFRCK